MNDAQSGSVSLCGDAPWYPELAGRGRAPAPRLQTLSHRRGVIAIAEDQGSAVPLDIGRLQLFEQRRRLIRGRLEQDSREATFSWSTLRTGYPALSVFAMRLATRNDTAATGPTSRDFAGSLPMSPLAIAPAPNTPNWKPELLTWPGPFNGGQASARDFRPECRRSPLQLF